MAFIYAFFIDLFYLKNFMIQIELLLLCHKALCREWSWKKIVMWSAGNTLVEVVFLLVCKNYLVYVLVSQFMLVPGEIILCLNKPWKKSLVTGYMVSILFTGVFLLLDNWFCDVFGKGDYVVWISLLSFLISWFGIDLLFAKKFRDNFIYDVCLICGEKHIECKGFYDSGNLLCHPSNQRPVHIVSEKVLKELVSLEEGIPIAYHSLGNMSGVIFVYEIDELHLKKDEKSQKMLFQKVYLGNGKEILNGKEYDVIIHSKIKEQSYVLEAVHRKNNNMVEKDYI